MVQVAIFYLVLRALDTIEDDMTLPIEVKEPILLDFHNKLTQDGWNFQDCKHHPEQAQTLASVPPARRTGDEFGAVS